MYEIGEKQIVHEITWIGEKEEHFYFQKWHIHGRTELFETTDEPHCDRLQLHRFNHDDLCFDWYTM